jgi:hypothetical protein
MPCRLILKAAISIKHTKGPFQAAYSGQIKRFLVSPDAAGEQVNVLLTKVSSQEVDLPASFR